MSSDNQKWRGSSHIRCTLVRLVFAVASFLLDRCPQKFLRHHQNHHCEARVSERQEKTGSVFAHKRKSIFRFQACRKNDYTLALACAWVCWTAANGPQIRCNLLDTCDQYVPIVFSNFPSHCFSILLSIIVFPFVPLRKSFFSLSHRRCCLFNVVSLLLTIWLLS